MKMNVHILGQHVGVLEQVGDFKSVMAYLPDVAPESLVSLTRRSRNQKVVFYAGVWTLNFLRSDMRQRLPVC
jgi:hypothetical protein